MDRAINLALKRGQFIITPLKKVYKRRLLQGRKQAYHAWAVENEQRCFVKASSIEAGLISIVVPVYNTLPDDLLGMVYSVINQHYQNWELVLVDASSEIDAQKRVSECSKIDTRIKVISTNNEGIAANTNAGIKAATGKYLAFLDHDDLLHACALHCMAEAIIQSKGELVYSDEDKISADSSQFSQPFLKPGWSPDLFRNVNYINHLTVIKTEYVHGVGGLLGEFDGAQDFDLLWRVIDKYQPTVVHIPRVLYHWRMAATSTAHNFQTKDYVLKAGTKAVQDHLDRNKISGKAMAIENFPGFYTVDYEPPAGVSIVIGPVQPSNQRICLEWMKQLASMLPEGQKTEWIVGDWYKSLSTDDMGTVKLIHKGDKNYWQAAAKLVSQQSVLCFQSGATPQNHRSLEMITAAAYRTGSIIAPVLIDRSGLIVDAAYVESSYGLQKLFETCKLGEDSYYGSTTWNRNVAALSMQVFAAPNKKFVSLAESAKGAELKPQARNSQSSNVYAMYAHAPFIYKGVFMDPDLSRDAYFNPQLTGTFNKAGILHSDWGKLKDESERDNAS